MAVPAVKSERLLQIYSRLVRGDVLSKKALVEMFHVTGRSVQRDIESLRSFFAEEGLEQQLIYDREQKGYRLYRKPVELLSAQEALVVCKILLESRSMTREEMFPILEKLLAGCTPEPDRRAVADRLANEKFHYIPPHHGSDLLEMLWAIGQAVRQRRCVEVSYLPLAAERPLHSVLEPVSVMFSEYYFYMVAFPSSKEEEQFPRLYRIDRVQELRPLEQQFEPHCRSRMEERAFRQRVQFNDSGQLQKVRFRYTGLSVEAVLDRLPSARLLEQDDRGCLIEAQVYGNGIESWLRSQGSLVEVLAPRELVQAMR